MTKWAIGSAGAFAALPAATQAEFAARYDKVYGAGNAWETLAALTSVTHLLPDDYQFVYIEDITENQSVATYPHNYVNGVIIAPIKYIDITALVRTITVTVTNATGFSMVDQPEPISLNGNNGFRLYGFTIEGQQAGGGTDRVVSVQHQNKNGVTEVYDMIIYDHDPVADRLNYCLQLSGSFQDVSHRVWESIFYNGINGIRLNISNPLFYPRYPTIDIENCDFHACDEGIEVGVNTELQNTTIRNCVSFASNSSDYGNVILTSDATFEYCADSDNSLTIGTNNVHNIVPANEFQSTTYGDADYLRLKNGSIAAAITATPDNGNAPLKVKFSGDATLIDTTVLGSAGVAPTYAGATDFDGNTRPNANGDYAIGAFEVVYA